MSDVLVDPVVQQRMDLEVDEVEKARDRPDTNTNLQLGKATAKARRPVPTSPSVTHSRNPHNRAFFTVRTASAMS
ncbi:hypothetical protein VTO58DRAFT_106244 [Aureobasidium pullulans]